MGGLSFFQATTVSPACSTVLPGQRGSTGSSFALATASARISFRRVRKECLLFPEMFRGRQSCWIKMSSSTHGCSHSAQHTRTFSFIHADSSDSPSENVIRVPLPTRRNSIPSSSRNKQPSVFRRVDPSALPVRWYLMRLLRLC